MRIKKGKSKKVVKTKSSKPQPPPPAKPKEVQGLREAAKKVLILVAGPLRGGGG